VALNRWRQPWSSTGWSAGPSNQAPQQGGGGRQRFSDLAKTPENRAQSIKIDATRKSRPRQTAGSGGRGKKFESKIQKGKKEISLTKHKATGPEEGKTNYRLQNLYFVSELAGFDGREFCDIIARYEPGQWFPHQRLEADAIELAASEFRL
jgi:hypothetical protein